MKGREIGHYHMLELLGAGGMGKVYQARELSSGDQFAIKVLAPAMASDELLLRRFQREARILSTLDHPNIVRGFGLQRTDGLVYLVMEIVTGETARERLIRKGSLSVPETLNIALAVISALSHVAEHGIVHRDVKPANIILDEIGEIKLVDFGLSRIENATMVLTIGAFSMGTPLYSAPEQNEDARDVDHRSDIYALGVSMMHLLTGKHPFAGPSVHVIRQSHATQAMPSGADLGKPLPDELEKVLQKMAAKKPDDRYQDFETLESDLERIRRDSSLGA